MVESQGYSQVLKPYLLEKLNQSFPDPTKIDGQAREAQWLYECKVVSIFKKVVLELLAVMDGYVEEAKALEKKKKGEKDIFGIGREGTYENS